MAWGFSLSDCSASGQDTGGQSAADVSAGAPPQTPPGALPRDPGFFPSGEQGEAKPKTEHRILITAGT